MAEIKSLAGFEECHNPGNPIDTPTPMNNRVYPIVNA